MRPIPATQLLIFLSLAGLAVVCGGTTAWGLARFVPLGVFEGVALTFATAAFTWCYALGFYRIVLKLYPLRKGSKPPGSRAEFGYHLYVLFNLFFFYPLAFSGVLPIPLLRVLYTLMGARIGTCSYGPAHIPDPILTSIGTHCQLGHGALLAAHHQSGSKLSHWPIRIGNRVTIGGGAMVGAGVHVDDDVVLSAGCRIAPHARIGAGAVIEACAFIKAGTRVRAGETWAGIPAVCVRGATPSPDKVPVAVTAFEFESSIVLPVAKSLRPLA